MTRPPTIKRLSRAVAEKIAAGEVVLHPCAAVKELVENALDAGADDIRVALHDGGLAAIEVIDNGCGIGFEELPLALERHATSKISDIDDLQKIATLGFRGEALPSIAAVSRLTIESRPQATAGGKIEVRDGAISAHEAAGVPFGTRVFVEALFETLPARRKFMKSAPYEAQRTSKMLNRLALAYPQVSFRLTHNGKPIFFYPRVESRERRLGDVLGEAWRDNVEQIAELGNDTSLTIFFTRPPVSFANAQQQFYFLNNRAIADRNLAHAVAESYRTLVMEHRYPGVALFLELSPDRFDVNVHPSKEEVRFVDPSELHRRVVRLLRPPLGRFKVAPSMGMDYLAEPAPAYFADMGQSALPLTMAATTPMPVTGSVAAVSRPFTALRLLGQFRNSYIVCEDETGMLLIDQHAAHERILFEKIRRRLAEPESNPQQLLTPLTVQLQTAELQTLQRHLPALQSAGFEIEPFGGDDVLVRAVPQQSGSDPAQLLKDLLHDLEESGALAGLEAIRDKLAASLACHSAVRFHQPLSVDKMQRLLEELDMTDAATNCPHGRPVFVRFDDNQLARLFKRI